MALTSLRARAATATVVILQKRLTEREKKAISLLSGICYATFYTFET